MFKSNPAPSLKEHQVWKIFDSIAYRYDLANLFMSWGAHCYWRNQLIQSLSLPKNCKVLDLCCGTGAITQDLPQLTGSGGQVVGGDFSEAMLSIAKHRVSRSPLRNQIQWVTANAMDLPFSNGSFDCITVAYGLRNVADIPRTLTEMKRVLKPGGQIAILEMAIPENPVIKKLHKLYLNYWIPFLGDLLSHNRSAYQYLYESICAFPHPDQICRLLYDTGFTNIQCRRFTLGVVALYTGESNAE